LGIPFRDSFRERLGRLGVNRDIADELFSRFFLCHWEEGIWPFVRLGLDESRYLEIEFAEVEMEAQDGVWIGTEDGPRVLLGYYSSHFSFPTLRMAELLTIANQMKGHPAAPVLLLRGAYLAADEKAPKDAISRWLQHVPGIKPEYVPDVLADLVKNVVPELRWRNDSKLGWINDSVYSQRNPESTMSVLQRPDFQFIKRFFDEA